MLSLALEGWREPHPSGLGSEPHPSGLGNTILPLAMSLVPISATSVVGFTHCFSTYIAGMSTLAMCRTDIERASVLRICKAGRHTRGTSNLAC